MKENKIIAHVFIVFQLCCTYMCIVMVLWFVLTHVVSFQQGTFLMCHFLFFKPYSFGTMDCRTICFITIGMWQQLLPQKKQTLLQQHEEATRSRQTGRTHCGICSAQIRSSASLLLTSDEEMFTHFSGRGGGWGGGTRNRKRNN